MGRGREEGEVPASCLCTHEYVCLCVPVCFNLCFNLGPLGDSDACYCLRALVYLDFPQGPSYPFKASRGRRVFSCMVRAAACSSSALESTALQSLLALT